MESERNTLVHPPEKVHYDQKAITLFQKIRQAWLDEKVAVIFDDTHSWQCLYSAVSQFDDAYDIAVIVRRTPLGTPEDLHNYLGQILLTIAI